MLRSKGATESERITNIKWTFLSIADMAKAGMLRPGELSTRMLGQNGQRGMIEKLMLKRLIKDHMLTTLLDELKFPSQIAGLMRAAAVDHKTFREKVGWPGNTTKPDMAWTVDFIMSHRCMFKLLEDLVFSTEYDPVLIQCVKMGKSAADSLDYGRVSDRHAGAV